MYKVLLVLLLSLGSYAQASFQFKEHLIELKKQGSGSQLVIFESGFGTDLTVWNKVIEKLDERYTVISYSRLGLGNSTYDGKPLSIEENAQILLEIVRHFRKNKSVTLVGHSIGGLIVQKAAFLASEQIDNVLLVDSAVFSQRAAYLQLNEQRVLQDDQMMLNYMPPAFQQRYKNLIVDMLHSNALEVSLPVDKLTLMTSTYTPKKPFVLEETKEGKALWLKLHKQLVSKNSGAKHVIFNETGHNIHTEQPLKIVEELNELIK